MDAGAFGARLGPKDAYRFAKGEEVIASSGQRAKLSRPLDFLVVADHSDGMGFFPQLIGGDPGLLATPQGRKWYDEINSGKGAQAAIDIITSFGKGQMPKGFPTPGTPAYRSAWRETIKAAEEANEPGRFTAFIGYEWTSNAGGNNLHRNIIWRDNGAKASLVEPYTTQPPLGSPNPRDLWKWMAMVEEKTGAEILALAHNGNLSNGRMFPIIESFNGKRIDREYAENRTRWEPLYEATQMKGDGETHPFLSPNDEFANYETLGQGQPRSDRSEKTGDARIRVCPFGTQERPQDGSRTRRKSLQVRPGRQHRCAHRARGSRGGQFLRQDIFFRTECRIARRIPSSRPTRPSSWAGRQTASGYAAVWATENTREAIFDAMKRRETYATTGPRMVVRFFGGWDFEAADANNRMPARIGYTKGVPMGGDLTNAPKGKSPSFLVAALKDPIGANLDRIQVIKGWVGKDGQTQERIYDVAVSGGRKIDADGRSRTPVGSTVDVANATWTNTIGAGEMITVWKDPDFDPALRAFYYVRVIEIPTPRWTAYDAKYFGVKMPAGSQDDDHRTRLHLADLVHALIARLLREPLLQFLALGAAAVRRSTASSASRRAEAPDENRGFRLADRQPRRTDLRGRGGDRRASRNCRA